MAKVVGLVGAASGKLGNVVYAVTNGIQVARVYQPQVYNPKSPLQSQQRAKGNLAGRMSSFVPRTAIMGLGANNRSRRGEWLRNVLSSAVVTSVEGGYKATINAPDVVFSRGTVPSSFVVANLSASTNVVTVALQGAGSAAITPEDYAAMQTRLVALVYDATTKDLVECVTKIATKPIQEAIASSTMLIAHPSGYIADVYAIPMSSADGSAVSISGGLAMKGDNEIAAELSVNANAVIFQYGKSVLLGTATFTPSQSKEEISENETKQTRKK